MGNIRISQVSFSRGEFCPPLYARTDIEQYSIGLKTLKNGFVRQEGCVSNRFGLEFVGEVKDITKEVRLIPFVFNTEQTYIIEAGDRYFRFIQDGGYIIYPDNYSDVNKRGQIVEIATPYKSKDLARLKFAQSADVLTITHLNYAPRELVRLDHHEWQLNSIQFEPSITPPTNVAATWTGSTSSNTRSYTYLVTAVDKETLEESNVSATVTKTGHREAYWTTSEYMTITWNAVAGASEYNIYRSVNGIYGYIGTSKTTSFTDDNIEPDLSETAPIQNNPFKNGNNPSCCAYFQQRKIYANTVNNPQTLNASQTATSNNFNHSRPLIASDAVEIPLADREVNEIMHLIPFADLLALTTNSVYKINGADKKFEANPMPVATIQTAQGSSHVQPIISGNMVVFVEAGGSVLRELGYEYLSDSYDGDELSLYASHLFEGKEIKYIAYAKAPFRLIFVLFNDGTLATLTYNKKQKLCGWGRQETDGLFESVAAIREGNEDVAYFVIKRLIAMPYYDAGTLDDKATDYYDAGTLNDAATNYVDCGNLQNCDNGVVLRETKYVERTTSRIIKNAKEGFLVDCGLAGAVHSATGVISGLEHLEGRKVIVNADGGIIENLVVKDGRIKLQKPVDYVVVGLPYEFEFETLGVEGENTHGLKKLINTVTINVLNSREDFWVCGNNGHETQLARSIASINDSGYLYSGKKDATPLNDAVENATIHIKQKYPLPITISAVSAIVNSEDISEG